MRSSSLKLYQQEDHIPSRRAIVINSAFLALIMMLIVLILSTVLTFSLSAAMLAIIALDALLAASYLHNSLLHTILCLLMIAGMAGALYLYRADLIKAVSSIISGSMNISAAIVLIMISLLTVLLYEMIIVLEMKLLPLILAALFLILAAIMGIALPLVALLIIASFGFYVLIRPTRRKAGLLKENIRWLIIPFVILCLIISPLIYLNDTFFYDISYKIEDLGVTSYLNATHDDNSIISGRVSRGNNHRTSRGRLKVTVDRLPAATIYLKNFVGSTYQGDRWAPVDDNKVLEKAVSGSALESVQYLNWIQYSMYYRLNAMTNENASRIEMGIKQLTSGKDEFYHVPYLAAYKDSGDGAVDYTYDLYERDEMAIDWDHDEVIPDEEYDSLPASSMAESFNRYKNICRQLITLYHQQALKDYTTVDTKKVSRLADYVSEHKLIDLNEVTAFIIETLEENATYTTTPGNTPVNKDIVDYFLFENHQGYCVHFASAATLMYRLYHVPARYVSGYTVEPSEFKKNDDGTYSATITDQKAHAWTEIWLDDVGWTPIEVTPDANGSINASYPGLDLSKAENALANKKWNFSLGDKNKEQASSFLNFDITPDEDFFRTAFKAVIIILIIILIMIKIIRHLNKKKMKVREIYHQISFLYHEDLPELNGNEESFLEQFHLAYPEIDMKDITRMQETANKVAFSSYKETQEDILGMWDFYERLYHVIIKRASLFKRALLLYLHL